MIAPAGAETLRDAPLVWALVIGAALLFALTMAALAWALLGAPAALGRVRAAHWIAGGGLLLPAVVLGALQVANLRQMVQQFAQPPPKALVVGVGARLWWWDLRFTDPASGAEVAVPNELHLPIGRPVRLALSGDDVIHSVWVPALAGKVDVIPGRVQHLVLQAEQAGRWRGPCAEFCGGGHSQMVLEVQAQSPAEFNAWLALQALPARDPATDLQARGRQQFLELRCAACHAVRGVTDDAEGTASPLRGPDLTHVASRRTLGAGSLANDEAGLRRWISDVQGVKRGAQMPSYPQLDAATLDALVAWLGSLE